MALNYGSAEHWRWNGSREAVEFTVHDENGKVIQCRISRECIRDNLGNHNTPESMLGAAKANFDPITDLAGALISAGRFDRDGSITIRSLDWDSRPR